MSADDLANEIANLVSAQIAWERLKRKLHGEIRGNDDDYREYQRVEEAKESVAKSIRQLMRSHD